MTIAGRAAACAVVVCGCSALSAQTLGEIAKKIEERRAGARAAVTLDERDVNPTRARAELLEFRIDTPRWQRFVEADRRVAAAITVDPGIVQRLEGLNYTTVRSVGWFFNREPAIAAALRQVHVDPHDYAYTYLATKLALSNSYASEVAVQSNQAFLKPRQRELKTLAIPLEMLSLHALASRAPEPAPVLSAPASRPTAAPTVAAIPARVPDAGGRIDMSMGMQIPDFSFVDFEGRRRQLSDFRGRYLMLDFWGSWCPPCRGEVPYVKDAYVRFGARGFEVLGMDSERNATVDQVRDYLRKNGVQWTFATPDSVRDLINDRFQIEAFPTAILLDPDGRVVEARTTMLRGERLAKTLDRLLPRWR
jgi:thiol-disulfide isomerase/thioredoxin